MLTNNTLIFLKELNKNNNKEWFEKNRKCYEYSQSEIKQLLALWITQFGKTDGSIANLEPQKCIFRINRDVRFSADKNPYKSNLGAYLAKGAKQTNFAGYYLHIEPGNCFFGAGNYMPTPEQLARIRQEIDYNFTDFKKIISAKTFVSYFPEINKENKLKRAPKGYEETNEAIEFLKMKSYTVISKINDKALIQPDFVQQLVILSKTVKPFIDFLNNAVEE